MPGPWVPGVRLAVKCAFWIRTVCVPDTHGVRLLPLSRELDVTRATHVSTALAHVS